MMSNIALRCDDMKKILLFIIVIMICSTSVFASSIYVDKETGTEITLPDNWSEVPLLKERQYIDAKFMNSDETAIVTYGSYDLTSEGFSEDEAKELRAYLNMSYMTIDDAKEYFGEEGFSNIEKVTYNGVDYFKAEMKTTQTIEGQQYEVEQIQFIHFNNGWSYSFMIEKLGYYASYNDFKSLIESVKYPHSNEFDYKNSDLSSNAKTALSYYELFQQGPAVYIPIILIMLLITLVAYAIFPLIFAFTRKKVITKTKYNIFCYGINFLVMFFFIIVNGKSSGSPYFLWTCIFSVVGTNILKRRRVLEGYQPLVSAFQDDEETNTTPSSNIVDETITDENKEKIQINVCKKCGASIEEHSRFCHKCGTRLHEEE